MNQMFKKYLIKNEFWRTGGRNETWFVKHTPEYGGIYAKLMQKGVEIQYNNEKKVFTNFIELDNYLDRISVNNQSNGSRDFISILNRKVTSKILRSLPL